jgi:hypothetical protein
VSLLYVLEMPIQKWDYLVETHDSGEKPGLQEKLDDWGEHGWELASFTAETQDRLATIILKRPKE